MPRSISFPYTFLYLYLVSGYYGPMVKHPCPIAIFSGPFCRGDIDRCGQRGAATGGAHNMNIDLHWTLLLHR